MTVLLGLVGVFCGVFTVAVLLLVIGDEVMAAVDWLNARRDRRRAQVIQFPRVPR